MPTCRRGFGRTLEATAKWGCYSNIVEVPIFYLVDLSKIEAIFHKFAFISAVERAM